MNAIARSSQIGRNASVPGLFVGILLLAGCITTNCADCGKDRPCAGGPGECGTMEITEVGDSSGCAVGTFKCANPGMTCDPGKKCKTLGAPNCTCACRR